MPHDNCRRVWGMSSCGLDITYSGSPCWCFISYAWKAQQVGHQLAPLCDSLRGVCHCDPSLALQLNWFEKWSLYQFYLLDEAPELQPSERRLIFYVEFEHLLCWALLYLSKICPEMIFSHDSISSQLPVWDQVSSGQPTNIPLEVS